MQNALEHEPMICWMSVVFDAVTEDAHGCRCYARTSPSPDDSTLQSSSGLDVSSSIL